jgi:hypothetical protein
MSDSDISVTVDFFRKVFPNPKSKNIHTQLGVHFEEIGEMVVALKGKDQQTQFLIDMIGQALKAGAIYFKEKDNVLDIKPEAKVEILDGICDQIVTASVFGYMLDMDVPGAFGEINRSNASKLDVNGEPIFDQNLKMIKGPNYFKPNLEKFI